MDKDKILEGTLSQDSHWVVNKNITRAIGIEAAAMLSDLISKKKYFRSRGELDDKGGFFNTSDNLQRDLNISDRVRRRLQKILIDHKLVQVKKRGVPAKNYWYINSSNVLKMMSSEYVLDQQEITQTESSQYDMDALVGHQCPSSDSGNGLTINNNKIIRTKNNNTNQPSADDIEKSEKKEMVEKCYNDISITISDKMPINTTKKMDGYIYGAITREGPGRLKSALKNYLNDPRKIQREYDDLERFFYDSVMIARYAAREYDDELINRCSNIVKLFNNISGSRYDEKNKFIVDQMINSAKAVTTENTPGLDIVGKAMIALALSKFHIENDQLDVVRLLRDQGLILKFSAIYDRRDYTKIIKNKVNLKSLPDIRKMTQEDIIEYDWSSHNVEDLKMYLSESEVREFIKSNFDMPLFIGIMISKKESV